MDCDFNKGPGPEQICKVNVEGLFQGACTNEIQYGWKAGTPCIAIKLNKVRYHITPSLPVWEATRGKGCWQARVGYLACFLLCAFL